MKIKKRISLIPHINKALNKRAEPYVSKNKQPRLKASSFSSPCLRQILYDYTHTTKDFSPSAKEQKIFDVGHAIHELIQEWLQESGVYIPFKDPITGLIPINKFNGKPDPEFPITFAPLEIKKGGVDGVVKLSDQLWLVEAKSIKQERFEELIETKKDHRIQANIYIGAFEQNRAQGAYSHIPELEGTDIVQGVIYLYLNKNTGEFKEYVESFDKEVLHKVFKKYEEFKEYVNEKELPPKTDHFCPWCPWRTKCKKEFNPLRAESHE